MTERCAIPYRLVRSARRTLALTLDADGQLTARAPRRMPVSQIEGFIAQKAGWIQAKQALLQQRDSLVRGCSLEDGSFLPYMGGRLRIAYAHVPRPQASQGVLTLPRQGDPLKHALSWFYQSAAENLPPIVDKWSRRMNVAPGSLTFGHAKARWGSMSTTGAMRLNIALLHCPPEMVDYVVVHELAHRLHPNHSKAFHACVAGFLPGADALRTQMKGLTPYLTLLRTPDAKEVL